MKGKFLSILPMVFIAAFLGVLGCVDPYSPAIINTDISALVVDGFLNTKTGVATVKLTRSLPVYSKSAPPVVTKALVKLRDENGTEYILTDKGSGAYEGVAIPTDANTKYQLSIQISAGEQYQSEFVPVKVSPKIDSVFWLPYSDGIRLYVNTHDPENSTRYYRWEATETYEYRSIYGSGLKIVGGLIVPRPTSEQINQCWRTIPPTDIQIASSIATTDDAISNFELKYIEKGSIKISKTYSLLVRQYAVTEQAFDYWRELEQSTENLGSLFDPMPSQITGNISNISNPQNVALGYFSAGTYEEKRIYVNFYDLPKDLRTYGTSCAVDTILVADIKGLGDNSLLIGSFGDPMVLGYLTARPECIDCRLHGGTTTKPSFWP